MRLLVIRKNRYEQKHLVDALSEVFGFIYDCIDYSDISTRYMDLEACEVNVGGHDVTSFDKILFVNYPDYFFKGHDSYNFICSENNAALDYLLHQFSDLVINYDIVSPERNLQFFPLDASHFLDKIGKVLFQPLNLGYFDDEENASTGFRISLILSLRDQICSPYYSVNFLDHKGFECLQAELRKQIWVRKLDWLSVDLTVETDGIVVHEISQNVSTDFVLEEIIDFMKRRYGRVNFVS